MQQDLELFVSFELSADYMRQLANRSFPRKPDAEARLIIEAALRRDAARERRRDHRRRLKERGRHERAVIA
jgi:hypothetical protein